MSQAGRRSLPPRFEPGSGWHPSRGHHTQMSLGERQAMRKAAFLATVVVLRRRGERIPAVELLGGQPPSGWLVCLDRYTAPNWYACLFRDEQMQHEITRLLHARLERESDGVRLYGGIEVDAQGRQEWRQAWLCTPTPDRAREILLEMLQREGGLDPLPAGSDFSRDNT
jgi:hypothetical protein